MDRRTIPLRIGRTIDTVSFLATEVFPDVDVAYRYVVLLYLSTACLCAAKLSSLPLCRCNAGQ
jgi:hypothetical protein